EGFKEKDIKRMKRLAELFPGSFFVFSALKPALSEKEKKLIGTFVKWGAVKTESGKKRANIIILTETELFSDYCLAVTWKKLGGKHEELVMPPSVRLEILTTLA